MPQFGYSVDAIGNVPLPPWVNRKKKSQGVNTSRAQRKPLPPYLSAPNCASEKPRSNSPCIHFGAKTTDTRTAAGEFQHFEGRRFK